MMMRNKERRPSMVGLYRKIIIVMIPIILFALFLRYYIEQGITKQVLAAAHDRLENLIAQRQELCQNASQSLLMFLAENEAVSILQQSDDPYLRNLANRNLQEDFIDLRVQLFGNYHFFFYDKEKEELILPTPPYMSYSMLDFIKGSLIGYMNRNQEQLGASDKKWKLLEVAEEEWIILKVYRSKNICMGCFFTLDSLLEDFGMNVYNNVNNFMMLEEKGQIKTGRDLYIRMMGTEEVLVGSQTPSYFYGDYELAWYAFEKGDFSFVFFINILENYQDVKNLLLVLCGLLPLLFLVGIWLLFYVRRRLLRPLDSFVRNLSLEDLEQTKSPYFAELADVDQLFRNARKQIEELKIEVYEKELEQQKMELEYLQLQIKPHFYVNCMNIIYNMAQSGKTDAIQRLSFEIARYLRSLFRQGSVSVTIQEELEHVEEYLNIQAIRYEGELEWDIQVKEEEKQCQIAPLLIHTLVENSVKHALLSQQILKITLKVERQRKEKEYLDIQVSDNGTGFPEQVLERLAKGENLVTEDGRRVGLCNMVKRLRYFYQEKADISFSNLPEGGAFVELLIPIEEKQKR